MNESILKANLSILYKYSSRTVKFFLEDPSKFASSITKKLSHE